MVIASNLGEIEECLQSTLKEVLQFDELVLDCLADSFLNDNDKCVASMDFFGDQKGTCVLAIPKEQVESTVHMILKMYGMASPTDPDLVFPEMLNVLGGNLVTALGKKGFHYGISYPERIRDISSINGKAGKIYKAKADCDFACKFCFYLRKESI